MLPLATIHEIDRLLKAGNSSQRKIARRLGVSRGTVAAIATGRRGIYGKVPEDEASKSLAPQSPPVRCPECGFLIYRPCQVCRARGYRQQQRALRTMRPARGRLQTRRAASRSAAVPRRALQRARVA
jgi:hypothetical protein